mmetsp:Transcript_35324/g.56297  ORF Transcript_35324/g.56297 Transcript_35324/m.56297 type:complete len:254 (+) Transcript_35324:59-820(+)
MVLGTCKSVEGSVAAPRKATVLRSLFLFLIDLNEASVRRFERFPAMVHLPALSRQHKLPTLMNLNSQTPTLQRAPPSPPPAPPRRGGGGGGGGGGEGMLRRLSASEAASILPDWLGMTKLYQMTDNTHLADAHTSQIDKLEYIMKQQSLQSEASPLLTRTRQPFILLGLFHSQTGKLSDLAALVTIKFQLNSVLFVKHIVARPVDINSDTTRHTIRALGAGLKILADMNKCSLVYENPPVEVRNGSESDGCSE